MHDCKMQIYKDVERLKTKNSTCFEVKGKKHIVQDKKIAKDSNGVVTNKQRQACTKLGYRKCKHKCLYLHQ